MLIDTPANRYGEIFTYGKEVDGVMHKFRFSYGHGGEADFISAAIELANDKTSPFTIFDAAQVAYEIGKRLEKC